MKTITARYVGMKTRDVIINASAVNPFKRMRNVDKINNHHTLWQHCNNLNCGQFNSGDDESIQERKKKSNEELLKMADEYLYIFPTITKTCKLFWLVSIQQGKLLLKLL